MKHIFLEKVFEYNINTLISGNDEFIYDREKGYWVDNSNNPCILNSNFAKPMTKKEDRETGEDKKGE